MRAHDARGPRSGAAGEWVSRNETCIVDVVCERKQTNFQRYQLAANTFEMEYEITLRNHKALPITVEVNEPIGGDWEMVSSTFKAEKTAATRIDPRSCGSVAPSERRRAVLGT